MLTVLGSRAASILRGSFLRKLLRWGQAVLRMAEERGRTYCPSALALLGADSLGLQDAHAKWSCSGFLWQSQNRKTDYFSYINTRQEESTESSMEVTLYHLPTSWESTQCYILIQTLKLEWKWHSASCDTHSVVAHLSRTTAGLVIHVGQGVIHNIDPFSATALQVFLVSFTTANHILI